MKRFAAAFFLAVLIHGALATALIVYLNYGSRRPTLPELDFSSVELSFAEAMTQPLRGKTAAPQNDLLASQDSASEVPQPSLENLTQDLSTPPENLPPELEPLVLPLPPEEEIQTLPVALEAAAQIKTPPRPASAQIRPDYPRASRQNGEEGRVVVDVTISAEGCVTVVKIVSSSGFARLDEAAEKAIRSARFRPARTESDTPIEGTLRIPLVFKLK